MKIFLHSECAWLNKLQNAYVCPEVNLIRGDGASLFLPMSLFAASSNFLQFLLRPYYAGVTTVDLPPTEGHTLKIFSQILLSKVWGL